MALTQNTDTYVTLDEANAYIERHYVSTNEQRKVWEVLTEADKEVYLVNATARLEMLSFAGKKYNGSLQVLAFPRVNAQYEGAYAPSVPDAIKHAQIEEALELCSPSEDTQEQKARRGAVESYSIGHLSETYRGGCKTILNSLKAQELVLPYLGGGHRVI